MTPRDNELARCRWPDGGCNRKIIWTTTQGGHKQPLDPTPVADGPVAAYRKDVRHWVSRVVTKAEAPALYGHESRFRPHHETCPKIVAANAQAAAVRAGEALEIPGLVPAAPVVSLEAARRLRRSRAGAPR